MNRKNSTPAHERRSSVANAVRKRGVSSYNLWLLTPPLEDVEVIASSDAEMELFYFLEGNPEIDYISYAPLEDSRWPDNSTVRRAERHFADIVRHGVHSRVIWCAGNTAQSASVAEADLYVTLAELDASSMRIDNWRRITGAIRRIRLYPTQTVERRVHGVLKIKDEFAVGDILKLCHDVPVAIVVGTIGLMLRKRQLLSDADIRPWSTHTMLSVRSSS